MAVNYYTIFGLPQNATQEQIRERFLALARERHPDRFRGEAKAKAEAEFQAITEAFNVLIHPDRRRQHDLELARPDTSGPKVDRKQVARVYVSRGVKAYRDKNFLEAAESFDRATREDPANARAWHHLARACAHQRRWLSRATSAIARACELEPMNATYLKLAGELFDRAGMSVRAVQYLREALKWGGDDAAVRQQLEELESGRKRKTGLFGRAGE
jgi:curved DNA-binding protein CbpA